MQQFSGMTILRAYVVKIFDELFSQRVEDSDAQMSGNSTVDCDMSSQAGSSTISTEAYISAIILGTHKIICGTMAKFKSGLYFRCCKIVSFTASYQTTSKISTSFDVFPISIPVHFVSDQLRHLQSSGQWLPHWLCECHRPQVGFSSHCLSSSFLSPGKINLTFVVTFLI